MRAARAYQSVGQHTAVIAGEPVDLVILLYEKLLQRLREVRVSIEKGDIGGRGEACGKGIELIEKGLIGCLDMRQGGSIAAQLKVQYDRWMAMILRCNVSADIVLLESIEFEVKEILSAWQELRAQRRSMREAS
ncbi:MAG: flagellar export chaperone FliS [Betaproteobacteria bacterium]|nr:flagellar export chaperone FliS [Betaproteobacteria bacterium]